MSRTLKLPCNSDPDLWFADDPADLERAKARCAQCPIRQQCLAAALQRAEPWGVWGGEILDRGSVIGRKRPRGHRLLTRTGRPRRRRDWRSPAPIPRRAA